MLCKLKRSIYRLNQASTTWNICFHKSIHTLGFDQFENVTYIYMKWEGNRVAFLILYFDYILLKGNNVSMLNYVHEGFVINFYNEILGRSGSYQ